MLVNNVSSQYFPCLAVFCHANIYCFNQPQMLTKNVSSQHFAVFEAWCCSLTIFKLSFSSLISKYLTDVSRSCGETSTGFLFQYNSQRSLTLSVPAFWVLRQAPERGGWSEVQMPKLNVSINWLKWNFV